MKSTVESQLHADAKKRTKRRGRRLTGISRQRRLANTRERNRVHTLNETIDKLRELVPLFPGEKRPSKTETIRLAALYIQHMTEILGATSTKQAALVNSEVIMEDLPTPDATHELETEDDLDLEIAGFLSDDAWLTNLGSEFTAGCWLSL